MLLATFRNHLLTILGDVTKFESDGFRENFDRVISIEMFEHMKNYELLLSKISGWIRPGGKLFVHIFTHKWKPYHFVDDWMARTFFTGEAITIVASFIPNWSILLSLHGFPLSPTESSGPVGPLPNIYSSSFFELVFL